jgi:hypothetical protein
VGFWTTILQCTCGYVNQKIVVALAETIKLMQLIDAAIASFPIE